MIITVGYFLLVALTAVALNPFLVAGLAIADVIIMGIVGSLILGYWQKEAMGELFENGSEGSLWEEDDVEEFMNSFDDFGK